MLELNKIYNMDCLDGMKQIDDNSIDMILCDLPYGVTQNKWDSIIPLDKLWEQYKRITKLKSAIVLTAIQPFTSNLIMSNIKHFKYEWIWEKPQGTGFLNAKKYPLKNHENIIVFCEKPHIYNPQFTEGKPYLFKHDTTKSSEKTYGKYKTVKRENNSGKRYPKTVIKFNNKSKNEEGLHPTQKPLALFEYLIKTYTNEEDIVLDNCIGSGTTAVACKRLNRRYIGFEINQEYYNIANKRLDNGEINGRFNI